jgi:hypothetical protein
MDTVANRLQETGQQLARQGTAFVSRTREAGQALVVETRDAGRQLVGAVQIEAKRWRRYAVQRTAQLRGEARTAFSLPAVERSVLTQVDQTLRVVSSRVRSRLAELEKPGKPDRKPARRKGAPRARKSRQHLPALAA